MQGSATYFPTLGDPGVAIMEADILSFIELSFDTHEEKERFAMVDLFYEQAAEHTPVEDPALLEMMLFYSLLRLNHSLGMAAVEKLFAKYTDTVSRGQL